MHPEYESYKKMGGLLGLFVGWWACMDMTTVGCDIVAVTPIGKIISFILAAAGIMMLPIFTVYITDRIAHSRNGNDKNATSESASDAGAKTSE